MNRGDLKTELYARGADYLSEDGPGVGRAERWINQAYREICNLQVWPFLILNTVGTPGLGQVPTPSLRRVLGVWDTSNGESPGRPLQYTTREILTVDDAVGDLLRSGTPEFYYVDTVQAEIVSYPKGGTIRARYVQRVSPMLTDADEPLFDEEYHNLIVDRAMIKVYQDSDNFEAAAALRAEFDSEIAGMVEDYMVETRDILYLDVGIPFDG